MSEPMTPELIEAAVADAVELVRAAATHDDDSLFLAASAMSEPETTVIILARLLTGLAEMAGLDPVPVLTRWEVKKREEGL